MENIEGKTGRTKPVGRTYLLAQQVRLQLHKAFKTGIKLPVIAHLKRLVLGYSAIIKTYQCFFVLPHTK